MDHTQQGVENIKRRILERLWALVAEKHIRLDPGPPVWFDGNDGPSSPDKSWRLTLSSHGETVTAEFTPAELDDFMAARPPDVVSRKLGRALDSLRLKK